MFNKKEVEKVQKEVIDMVAERLSVPRENVISKIKSVSPDILYLPEDNMKLDEWLTKIERIGSGIWHEEYKKKILDICETMTYKEFAEELRKQRIEREKRSARKIVIFGYSDIGKNLFSQIKKEKPYSPIIFCDNSSKKQGVYDGISVISLQEAVRCFKDAIFVVASLRHGKQMKQQLLDAGICQEQIDDNIPLHIVKEEFAKECKQRITPLDSIHIEVNINKDCNLNCKGCDHFAPIAEADTLELDVFERDMKRLAEIMVGHIHRIILLGGEPLLNKQLLDYVRIAHQCMPAIEIFIATNGTLLGKVEDNFWKTLKKNNTGLMVTKYPVKLDYEALRKIAEEKGAIWEYLGSSESGRSLWHFPLDLTGSQDPMESFIHCANANSCHTLERGRLYTCSIAPNIKAFNDYFGKNVPLTEEDGIDIHKAESAEEILKFLARPINFCKFCNVKGRTYDHGWEVSKKDIREWTIEEREGNSDERIPNDI